MSVSKMACAGCGASLPLSILSDSDYVQCPQCGQTLQVQHGDGYISLKIAEKVTDAIQDVGEQTQAAIRQEAQATSAEIKKLQAVSELSTLRMQLATIQAEIRTLEREKKSSKTTNQLRQLQNQEWNLNQKIQYIENQLSSAGSPNLPAQAASTGTGQGGCLGSILNFITARRYGGCLAAFVTGMLILVCGVSVFNPLDNLIALTTRQEFMGFTCLTTLLAFGIGFAVFLFFRNPQSKNWLWFKDFYRSRINEPAKRKPLITLGIMCGLLLGCVLMYAIPQGILSKSPAYHATQTVKALTRTSAPDQARTSMEVEATKAPILANQPTEAKKPLPTSTTEAPVLTIQPTATTVPVVLDVPSLFGKTSADLDKMLGKGTNPLPLEVNEAPEMPKGGRSLDYTFQGYTFTVFFDQDGKVGGFMLTEGLDGKGYTIDQAEEVLQLFGINVKNPPDGKTIGLVNWENEQGYLLRVLAFGRDQPIWSIQVWTVQ